MPLAEAAIDEGNPYASNFEELPTAKRKRTKKGKKAAASKGLQPFLKCWAIVMGIVLAVAAAVGIAGLFSEPLAIAATGICIAAIVLCILVGRFWMAIDLWKENVLHGIGALAIPLLGLFLTMQQRGPSMRGAIVFVSAMAPTLLLGLMLILFGPKYGGSSWSSGARSNSDAQNPDKWAELIRTKEGELPADADVRSWQYSVMPRPGGGLSELSEKGESLLSGFDSYVAGSFELNEQRRTFTVDCRGEKNLARALGFFLGTSTNTMVMLKPQETQQGSAE